MTSHFTERTLDAAVDHPTTAFGPVAEIFTAADLAMVNLETAVTTRGTPEPKTFHFRAPPTAYAAVAAAGIDVVSLANNHALDYGRVGLEDTLDSAAVGRRCRSSALGRNADDGVRAVDDDGEGRQDRVAGVQPGRGAVLELGGHGQPAGDRVWRSTPRRVGGGRGQAAKAAADVVVVYMHWGQEYNECPTSAR